MNILPYTSDFDEGLSEFYNGLIADVPHCHPTRPQDWADFLLPLLQPNRTSPFRFHRRLIHQQLLVAVEAGSVLGLGHSVVKKPRKKGGSVQGTIAFIAHKRGSRIAGQELLDRCEAFLQEHDVRKIRVFPGSQRIPFYHLDAAGLSDQMEHIHALLGLNGYSRDDGVVFWERRSFQPQVPVLLEEYGDITLEWSNSKGEPNLRLEANKNGEFLGMCDCHSFARYGSLTNEKGWCFVKWLGVEKVIRGKRLGVYILERTLEEMSKVGYEHVAIGTGYDNYRALSFYSNHGFRIVDWTYNFVKNIV